MSALPFNFSFPAGIIDSCVEQMKQSNLQLQLESVRPGKASRTKKVSADFQEMFFLFVSVLPMFCPIMNIWIYFILTFKHTAFCVPSLAGRRSFEGSQAACGDPAERPLLQRWMQSKAQHMPPNFSTINSFLFFLFFFNKTSEYKCALLNVPSCTVLLTWQKASFIF